LDTESKFLGVKAGRKRNGRIGKGIKERNGDEEVEAD
jgi:hypothetical protein